MRALVRGTLAIWLVAMVCRAWFAARLGCPVGGRGAARASMASCWSMSGTSGAPRRGRWRSCRGSGSSPPCGPVRTIRPGLLWWPVAGAVGAGALDPGALDGADTAEELRRSVVAGCRGSVADRCWRRPAVDGVGERSDRCRTHSGSRFHRCGTHRRAPGVQQRFYPNARLPQGAWVPFGPRGGQPRSVGGSS